MRQAQDGDEDECRVEDDETDQSRTAAAGCFKERQPLPALRGKRWSQVASQVCVWSSGSVSESSHTRSLTLFHSPSVRPPVRRIDTSTPIRATSQYWLQMGFAFDCSAAAATAAAVVKEPKGALVMPWRGNGQTTNPSTNTFPSEDQEVDALLRPHSSLRPLASRLNVPPDPLPVPSPHSKLSCIVY